MIRTARLRRPWRWLMVAQVAAAQTPAARRRPGKGQRRRCAMCQGCHGIPGWRTAYPEVYQVPKLAGQHAGVPRRGAQGIQERRSHASVDDARSPRRCPTRTWRISPRTTRGSPDGQQANEHPSNPDHAGALAITLCSAGAARRRLEKPRRRRTKSARPATAWTATARSPSYPKLGGQYPDYLAKALRDYKSGARKNPIMAGDGEDPHAPRTSRSGRVFHSAARGAGVALLTRDRMRRSGLAEPARRQSR